MIVVPEDRIRDFKARGWWGEDTLDDDAQPGEGQPLGGH